MIYTNLYTLYTYDDWIFNEVLQNAIFIVVT